MTKERITELRKPTSLWYPPDLWHALQECLHEVESLQTKVAQLTADKQRMADEIYRLTAVNAEVSSGAKTMSDHISQTGKRWSGGSGNSTTAMGTIPDSGSKTGVVAK